MLTLQVDLLYFYFISNVKSQQSHINEEDRIVPFVIKWEK